MIILKDQKMHNRAKVEEHLSLTVNKFNQFIATLATTFQEALSKLEN